MNTVVFTRALYFQCTFDNTQKRLELNWQETVASGINFRIYPTGESEPLFSFKENTNTPEAAHRKQVLSEALQQMSMARQQQQQ